MRLAIALLLAVPLWGQLDFTDGNQHGIQLDGGPSIDTTTDTFTQCWAFYSEDADWSGANPDYFWDSAHNGSSPNVTGMRMFYIGGVFRFRLYAGGGTATNLEFASVNAAIDENVWNLVCVAYDGTTMSMFLNDETTVTTSHGAGGDVDQAYSNTCLWSQQSTADTDCTGASMDSARAGPSFFADGVEATEAEFDQMYTMVAAGHGARFWEYAPRLAAAAEHEWPLLEAGIGSSAGATDSVRDIIGSLHGDVQNDAGTLDYVGPRLGN